VEYGDYKINIMLEKMISGQVKPYSYRFLVIAGGGGGGANLMVEEVVVLEDIEHQLKQ
jgi:hypothetical protein